MSNAAIAAAMGHSSQTPSPAKALRKEALTTGAVAALVLHAVAATTIFEMVTTRPAAPSVPIMVSMITAPTPEPSRPEPETLPKPKPVTQKPLPPLPKPLLAATEKTVAPAEAAPAPQLPPPAAAPPAEPAPAPAMVQPRFDAAYLDNPPPPYPPMSRRVGETGRVMLHVYVNADGSAGKVELRTSSGSPRLDQSALDTVKRWRFVPAKLGTQAIAAWVLVPISFTLGG